MSAQITGERNQDATVYVGNLEDRVTDALLWELMLQAGPVVNVHLPKDRVTQLHQGYGFVEFMTEEDADYAIKIMNMVKLYGKPLRVNKKAMGNVRQTDVGANLFIGNLDPDVDEKILYDTFSAFGVILQTPKVARDPDTGNPKGYGFVSFDNFESSDAAIEAMNGQYLANKPITVQYALKKDGKGERHGSAAERLLAAQAKKNAPVTMPNRLFGDAPGRPGMPANGGLASGRPAAPAYNAQPAPMMSSSGANNIPVMPRARPSYAPGPPTGMPPMAAGQHPPPPPSFGGQPSYSSGVPHPYAAYNGAPPGSGAPNFPPQMTQ